MNETLEKIKAWEYLKTEIGKIYEPKTRSLYYRAFLARCIDEWGFNPENPASGQKNTAIVDDWEKDFIQDVQDAISYGVDTREEKRKKEETELRGNLRLMIINGETLADIPDGIRTPHIEKIYLEELYKYGDELCKCADDLTKPMEI